MDGSLLPASRWPNLPDLDRLVEDLTATAPLFEDCAARGRRLHPPLSTLALFGARFLGEDKQDPSAARLRGRPWPLAAIVTQPQLTVLEGSVRLSYFLAAVAMAGAATQARRGDGGDWEAALAWLVLYGVPAHGLWSFVPAWFVSDLLRPSLRRGDQVLPPLLLLLLRDCPDLAAALPPPADPGFEACFETWLAEVGIARFGLFWLCTGAQLARARLQGVTTATPPGDLVWPEATAPVSPAPDAGRADRWQPVPEPTSLGAYVGFGPALPAVRVDLGEARAGTGAAWRLAADSGLATEVPRAAPALELTALSGLAALPAGWLPPGMMLLELALPPALAPLVWLHVELDGQPIGLRPGTELRPGHLQHLPVPQGTRTGAPLLDVRLGCQPEAFALAARAGGVFARLLGLQFWRLR